MSTGESSLSFTCDWRFGFNLSARGKATIGYLLFWSGCGGLNLQKDIEIWKPYEQLSGGAGGTLKCVGLIDTFNFRGGEEDPILISAYISKDVAADVRAKLARPLPTTKLKLTWRIVGYDDDRKSWYEAGRVRDDAKVEANVDTARGILQMRVDNEPTRLADNLDLAVYRFEFQVVPAAKKSALLEFATGPSQRLVRKWGV